MREIKKTCACGMDYGSGSWSRLRLLGKMDNGRGVGELIELRLCGSCGSSIGRPIGTHAPESAAWRVS